MNFGNSQKSKYFWERTIDVTTPKSEMIPKNRGCHEFWELWEGGCGSAQPPSVTENISSTVQNR